MKSFVCFMITLVYACSAKTVQHHKDETCTYSFTVPNDQTHNSQCDSRVSKLESAIDHLQSQLQLHTELFRTTLQRLDRAQAAVPMNTNVSVGSTYVRWGRTVYPETAELLYEGRQKSQNVHLLWLVPGPPVVS